MPEIEKFDFNYLSM